MKLVTKEFDWSSPVRVQSLNSYPILIKSLEQADDLHLKIVKETKNGCLFLVLKEPETPDLMIRNLSRSLDLEVD